MYPAAARLLIPHHPQTIQPRLSSSLTTSNVSSHSPARIPPPALALSHSSSAQRVNGEAGSCAGQAVCALRPVCFRQQRGEEGLLPLKVQKNFWCAVCRRRDPEGSLACEWECGGQSPGSCLWASWWLLSCKRRGEGVCAVQHSFWGHSVG